MGRLYLLILLDTHALIFWVNDDSILSKNRKEELDKLGKEKVFLSSLSFLEIYAKVRKGKLNLGETTQRFSEKIVNSNKGTIIDSNWKDFHLASVLAWEHSDPVDRVLVAQAKNRNMKLLSKDTEIKKFYKGTIWS